MSAKPHVQPTAPTTNLDRADPVTTLFATADTAEKIVAAYDNGIQHEFSKGRTPDYDTYKAAAAEALNRVATATAATRLDGIDDNSLARLAEMHCAIHQAVPQLGVTAEHGLDLRQLQSAGGSLATIIIGRVAREAIKPDCYADTLDDAITHATTLLEKLNLAPEKAGVFLKGLALIEKQHDGRTRPEPVKTPEPASTVAAPTTTAPASQQPAPKPKKQFTSRATRQEEQRAAAEKRAALDKEYSQTPFGALLVEVVQYIDIEEQRSNRGIALKNLAQNPNRHSEIDFIARQIKKEDRLLQTEVMPILLSHEVRLELQEDYIGNYLRHTAGMVCIALALRKPDVCNPILATRNSEASAEITRELDLANQYIKEIDFKDIELATTLLISGLLSAQDRCLDTMATETAERLTRHAPIPLILKKLLTTRTEEEPYRSLSMLRDIACDLEICSTNRMKQKIISGAVDLGGVVEALQQYGVTAEDAEKTGKSLAGIPDNPDSVLTVLVYGGKVHRILFVPPAMPEGLIGLEVINAIRREGNRPIFISQPKEDPALLAMLRRGRESN